MRDFSNESSKEKRSSWLNFALRDDELNRWYRSVLDGAGFVNGNTGWYLVVLSKFKLVLLDTWSQSLSQGTSMGGAPRTSRGDAQTSRGYAWTSKGGAHRTTRGGDFFSQCSYILPTWYFKFFNLELSIWRKKEHAKKGCFLPPSPLSLFDYFLFIAGNQPWSVLQNKMLEGRLWLLSAHLLMKSDSARLSWLY